MIPFQCPTCGSINIQSGSDGCNQPLEHWCLDCGRFASLQIFRKEYVKNHPKALEECDKCERNLYCVEKRKITKILSVVTENTNNKHIETLDKIRDLHSNGCVDKDGGQK